MDWQHDSSGRTPALKAQSSGFKLQYRQKKDVDVCNLRFFMVFQLIVLQKKITFLLRRVNVHVIYLLMFFFFFTFWHLTEEDYFVFFSVCVSLMGRQWPQCPQPRTISDYWREIRGPTLVEWEPTAQHLRYFQELCSSSVILR
jgi:hypothetical protein